MKETFTPDSPFLIEDTRKDRWAVPYNYEALNCRVEKLISANHELIYNATILDLGCHFGTFAWASIKNGAFHVRGIDPEKKLIDKARKLFELHDADKNSYSFECLDADTALSNCPDNSFDTILCLGVLYYTQDPFHTLKEMARVARKGIILDTFTARYAACMTKDGQEISEKLPEDIYDLPLMLCPLTQAEKTDYTLPYTFNKPGRKKAISMLTLPSETLLEYYFQTLNLDFRKISWETYVKNNFSWRDFIDIEVKRSSHWADIYHTGLRAAWVLGIKK